MTPENLTESLKAEATRLGFAFSGVCPAVTPHGFHHFLQWLDAGYAGEMSYLDERREAYRTPTSILPEVKSVLMLAMNYRSQPRADFQPGTGKIASYAWGAGDYHDLIHSRLKELKRFALSIDSQMKVRGVVDTAPLLERDFAQLAGLGWIGKNTLLLNKFNGSYFLLAALLVDRELIDDEPHETSHCGTCTACLDACPTDAFVAPYVLDATKCISYLTIEHRSPIDESLRERMDGWILGCDVCQDVCPWNRKSPLASEPMFDAIEGQNPIDLRPLFGMDESQFRERFRKTPLWRPKRRGILRNAAIALANRPDIENVDALLIGICDEEPIVRSACVWALGRHLFAEMLVRIESEVRGLVSRENDPEVLRECDACLTKISGNVSDIS